MGFLQQIYMWVLNPIYNITSKVSEPVRNKVIAVCFFLIAVQALAFTALEKQGIYYGYDNLLIIGTLLFCVSIVFSINAPLVKVQWNPIISIPWLICCVWMIVTGLHHNITVALLFFAVVMLIVFPCFYFVWNNREDYDVMFRTVSKAIVTAMAIYYIVNFLIAPYMQGSAYFGIAINPNSIGLAGVAGAIASLYLVLTEKRKVCYIILFGISGAFIYLSVSRASVIATGVALITFAIICLRWSYANEKKTLKGIVIISAVIISLVVSATASTFVLKEITPNTQEYLKEIFLTESYAEGIDESKPSNPMVAKFTKGTDLASFSSGRTVIWKSYIKELNFIGNDRTEALFINEFGHVVASHNNYIEIAYRCGILAGVLYAWIAIFAAVYSFRMIFGKKLFNYKYSLIPMAVMAFGVLSNLERALYPFEKIHILLFFIVLAPMFIKMKKEKSLD